MTTISTTEAQEKFPELLRRVAADILVRLAVPADPRHLSARRAIEALAEEGLYAASQKRPSS